MVTGLVFKMDASDGKKWVKFVAMQQNNATLIYDLSRAKSTEWRVTFKNIAQPFETMQFQA